MLVEGEERVRSEDGEQQETKALRGYAIHISNYILHYQADYLSQQLRVEDRCHTIGTKHMPIRRRTR